MSTATDDQLLRIGNGSCDVIENSSSFADAVRTLNTSLKSLAVTDDQSAELIRRAVSNLCPQHKDLLA